MGGRLKFKVSGRPLELEAGGGNLKFKAKPARRGRGGSWWWKFVPVDPDLCSRQSAVFNPPSQADPHKEPPAPPSSYLLFVKPLFARGYWQMHWIVLLKARDIQKQVCLQNITYLCFALLCIGSKWIAIVADWKAKLRCFSKMTPRAAGSAVGTQKKEWCHI